MKINKCFFVITVIITLTCGKIFPVAEMVLKPVISTKLLKLNNVDRAGTSYSPYRNFLSSNTSDDKNLVLLVVTEGSKRLLRVSFNGSEGTDGMLKIYNPSHELVKEVNFELIKDPYYATLDISEFMPGKYTAELTTGKGVHTSILTVK